MPDRPCKRSGGRDDQSFGVAETGWRDPLFGKCRSTVEATPKRNTGPVAEALVADIGTDQTMFCPAFPENARAIITGTLFARETTARGQPSSG